ncbi:tetratricopeptide repeat protein [Shewanella marisflavi]|uniref:tetratricopeptide repeat protein n=1 Tax=Shewanella marisflavi TaxID=260364 RepID=UPI00200C870C|nr:tetratricopeptide repeat protein [Shewanella marisflavi]MCL1042796.1 tetratricopeptide repeat protein [Shewanella marisflavi]
MSVINTMLKDLDKRQQSHGLDELPVPPLQYRQAPQSRLPWLLLLLLSLSLLVLGYFAWARFGALERTNLALQQDNQALTQEIAAGNNNPVVGEEALASSGVEPSAKEEPSANKEPSAQEEPSANKEPLAKEESSAHEQPSTSIVNAALGEEPLLPAKASLDTRSDNRGESIKAGPKHEAEPNTVKPAGTMAVTEVQLSPEAMAEKRLSQAKLAQEGGNLSQAAGDFTEVLRLNPALHEARQHLAALYYGQGRFDQAESVLAQGLALYPQEFDYALLLARVLADKGDDAGALAALGKIPDQHLLAKQKWVMQSHLAQKSGVYALAEESYRHLVSVEPRQAKWWMGQAYALDSQQKYASAKQAYGQALALPGLSEQASAFVQQRLTQLGDIE